MAQQADAGIGLLLYVPEVGTAGEQSRSEPCRGPNNDGARGSSTIQPKSLVSSHTYRVTHPPIL